MGRPHAGKPGKLPIGKCLYADEPGNAFCLADAQYHGLLLEEDKVTATFVSCHNHYAFMTSIATYTHPYVAICSIPESVFVNQTHENHCEVLDEMWSIEELITEAGD